MKDKEAGKIKKGVKSRFHCKILKKVIFFVLQQNLLSKVVYKKVKLCFLGNFSTEEEQ